jgi:tetratricopeptide (TPR) repeat protein
MQEGLAIMRKAGARYGLPLWLFALGELLLDAGRLDDAEAAIAEGAELTAATLNDYCASECPRLEGELLRRREGPTPAAEGRLRQALELAAGQSARALELRAAISLAHLYRQRGEREQARQVLEPVAGGFTEGLATRDLKRAVALLADLA